MAQAETDAAIAPAATYPRPDAILVFGGRMSTTDLASTMLFNIRYHPEKGQPPSYDNDIAGLEYEHDLFELARDVRDRIEAGLADRFGHYLLCCQRDAFPDATVRTNNRIHSIELWSGDKVRWENLHLGNYARLALAGTVGLSVVTRPIGRERQREVDDHGNAHLLFYLAPEVALSPYSHPEFELVVRVPHRSGAARILGNMEEGYNADVVGIRYCF